MQGRLLLLPAWLSEDAEPAAVLPAPVLEAIRSLGDFVVGDSDDPLRPPAAFTQWRNAGAWQASLYEPEMLATAGARTCWRRRGETSAMLSGRPHGARVIGWR